MRHAVAAPEQLAVLIALQATHQDQKGRAAESLAELLQGATGAQLNTVLHKGPRTVPVLVTAGAMMREAAQQVAQAPYAQWSANINFHIMAAVIAEMAQRIDAPPGRRSSVAAGMVMP